jgi:hypothetical protein
MSAKVRWLVLGGLVTLGLRGAVAAGTDDRNEYWMQVGARAQLNPEWEFGLRGMLKVRDDASSLYCRSGDGGFLYKGLADWVDVGVFFWKEYQKDARGQWRAENRPYFDVQFKTTACGFALSNRSRLEFRDLEGQRDYWRYRNMTKVQFPGEYTKFKLKPYLAEEPFFAIDAGGLRKNRVYAGVYCQLSPRIEGAVYYLWEAFKLDERWKNAHVLVTNVTFLLR